MPNTTVLAKLITSNLSIGNDTRLHVYVKELKNKGIHTWRGMLGYVSKDIAEQWYTTYDKGIRESDLREGKRLYSIFGRANPQQVCIFKQNILKFMHQHWACWLRGRVLAPESVLLKMTHTGMFTMHPHWWCSSTGGVGALRSKMRTAWLMTIAPCVSTMANVSDIFLDHRTDVVPARELPDEAPDENGQPHHAEALSTWPNENGHFPCLLLPFRKCLQ